MTLSRIRENGPLSISASVDITDDLPIGATRRQHGKRIHLVFGMGRDDTFVMIAYSRHLFGLLRYVSELRTGRTFRSESPVFDTTTLFELRQMSLTPESYVALVERALRVAEIA